MSQIAAQAQHLCATRAQALAGRRRGDSDGLFDDLEGVFHGASISSLARHAHVEPPVFHHAEFEARWRTTSRDAKEDLKGKTEIAAVR